MLEFGLRLFEFSSDEIRVLTGDVAQVVRATDIVEPSVSRMILGCLVVATEVFLVAFTQPFGGLGHGAPRPPSTDRAGHSTYESSDWPGRRADPGANQHARDPARRLADFVGRARCAKLAFRPHLSLGQSLAFVVGLRVGRTDVVVGFHIRFLNVVSIPRSMRRSSSRHGHAPPDPGRPRVASTTTSKFKARLDIVSRTLPIPFTMGRIRLGTQGWNYDGWAGPFYPDGTRNQDALGVYGRAFDTVEVDSTFYATPSATTVRSWAQRVPHDFLFSLKLPREITHDQRLRNATAALEQFADRARELGPKLGVVLAQFGSDFTSAELPALAQFLPTIPRDIRFAVEFRHRGWIHDGILALLREHRVALALTDGRWLPRKTMLELADRPTSDFVYVRWMGPDRTIADFSRVQVDRSREIEHWCRVMGQLAERGVEVYGYVSNHFSGHAPASVREMQRAVGQVPVDPEQMGEQMSLF